jgi:hypothetical protein
MPFTSEIPFNERTINLYHIVLENSSCHEENKPTGYTIFHLFTTEPTCFGLNDHHPEITLKILEAFKTIQC